MSDSNRHAQETQYLMCKVGLKSGDSNLGMRLDTAQHILLITKASECIKALSGRSTEDPTLLYACTIEAQKVGNKEQALLAMRGVLENHRFKMPSNINFPALVRYVCSFN